MIIEAQGIGAIGALKEAKFDFSKLDDDDVSEIIEAKGIDAVRALHKA